jgi:predicted phage tail protein
MRKIRIYGALAKFLKRRVFRAEVASAAEAVRFLVANFPAVEKHMADQHYRVSLGERDLALEEIHDPAGQQVIKIVPVVAGAGGAAGKILLGVALIAGAIILGPAAGGFLGLGLGLHGAGVGIIGGVAAGLFGGIGLSLALGGVAQLLTPTPKMPTGADSNNDPRKSYSFSSIQNTSRQDTPVPVVYGETIVGSVVISAGIDIAQVAA